MWFDEEAQAALTDDQLLDLLKKSKAQVILLEGPTGCGKSRLLKNMQQTDARRTKILAEDAFVRSLLATASAGRGEKTFSELADGCEVVCVEDIDLLNGKTATQEIAAQTLRAAAKEALVVLTGIRLRERVEPMLEELREHARLFEYREN